MVNKTECDPISLKRGVSQGILLDPLLFTFYINDIKSNLSKTSTFVQYTHDTTILASSASKRRNFKQDYSYLLNFFNTHTQALLKFSETEYNVFDNKNTNIR